MNIRINDELHNEVRKVCDKTGLKIQKFCERAIEKELASMKVRERTTSKN